MKKVILMKWRQSTSCDLLLGNTITIFVDEIMPRIKEINGTGKMIYTTGCSLGATHAANVMLRRPDLFMVVLL